MLPPPLMAARTEMLKIGKTSRAYHGGLQNPPASKQLQLWRLLFWRRRR
jgi:hypothetical protein